MERKKGNKRIKVMGGQTQMREAKEKGILHSIKIDKTNTVYGCCSYGFVVYHSFSWFDDGLR